MEVGAMSYQLSEGAKKQGEELETLSKKLAISEKRREDAEATMARAEGMMKEAEGLKRVAAQREADLRFELSGTKQVLESSQTEVFALKNRLQEAQQEMEARLASGRKREEKLQVEASVLHQSVASLEAQAKDTETVHLKELELAKVKAVEVFLKSEDFAALKVALSYDSYDDGYNLGSSRGFAAGFKRAVFMARERLGAGSSLDDLAQGDEAYVSDTEVPRTPQVQLPSTPIPVEDEAEPEIAAPTEPSTEVPQEEAAPSETPQDEPLTEVPAAPEVPADAAPTAPTSSASEAPQAGC